MAESRFRSGGGQNTNPNPEGTPLVPYDQMQVVQQVIDLRMDVTQLSTKTERAISDLSGISSDVKSGFQATKDTSHAIEVDVAKLVERVNHLPSKGFIVVALLLALSALGALIVFQGNIAKMVGVAPAIVAPVQAQVTPAPPSQ